MNRHSVLFKKVYGCLAGQAIGDQLGRPAEGWHYQDIDRKKGRLTNPWEAGDRTEGGDRSFEVGTDDTALALILCHTYIAKQGQITVEDYAQQWLKEMEPTRFFFCMRNTYELLKMGYSPRVTGAFNIVTGSGLMAIAPVGIYNACDPETAYVDALNISSMYQRDLDMFIPGIIAGAIAEALSPQATVDSVIRTAVKLAPDKKNITFDQRKYSSLKDTLQKAVEIGAKHNDVFAVREALYQEMLQYQAVDPQEVVALAFGIFAASGGDTEQAILGGANIGRDADTIASLNGQLSGALNGIDSIPENWRTGLEKCSGFDEFFQTVKEMARLLEKKHASLSQQVTRLKSLIEGENP